MSAFKIGIGTPSNEGYTDIVKPGDMGLTKLHFGMLTLPPEATFFAHSENTEVALIALGGHCTLLVGHNGNKANGILGERPDVFQGEACVAYIPHHTTYEVLSGKAGVEVAVCKVLSHAESAAVILAAGETVDENETHLRIWENAFSCDADVHERGVQRMAIGEEAICFHRFRDADGAAVCNIRRAASPVGVWLSHNDVLVIPEQARIVKIDVENPSHSVGYQLWMQPI